MQDKFYLNNCGENDVLSFGTAMFKVENLKEEVNNILNEYKLGEELSKSLSFKNFHIDVNNQVFIRNVYRYNNWFGDGINCEILRLGANGWQKGRVTIKLNVSLEFCPDEPELEETLANNEPGITPPESPLNDMRRMMTENN